MSTISVIIPHYNHSHYLLPFLDEILKFRKGPDEIVIVDDASTDGSYERIVDRVKHEPRVRLSRNEQNLGVINTLNNAVARSTGDYLSFPSADNQLFEGFFETSLDALERYPNAPLSVSETVCFHEHNDKVIVRSLNLSASTIFIAPEEFLALSRDRGFLVGDLGVSVMVRRGAVLELQEHGNVFDPQLAHLADFFAWQVHALDKGFVYIPHKLAAFRVSDDSFSGSGRGFRQEWRVFERLIDRLKDSHVKGICKKFADSYAFSALGWRFQLFMLVTPRAMSLFRLSLALRKVKNQIWATYHILFKG